MFHILSIALARSLFHSLTGKPPPQLCPTNSSSSGSCAAKAEATSQDNRSEKQASGSSTLPWAAAAAADAGAPLGSGSCAAKAEATSQDNRAEKQASGSSAAAAAAREGVAPLGNGAGWALRLLWDRAVRCLVKVSYRQPRLEPCWLVQGRWEGVGAAGLRGCTSDGDDASSTSSASRNDVVSNMRDDISSTSRNDASSNMRDGIPFHFILSTSRDDASCTRSAGGRGSGAAAQPRALLPSRLHSHALPDAVLGGEQLAVVFDVPVRALAPQQAAVVYELDQWAGDTMGKPPQGGETDQESCLSSSKAPQSSQSREAGSGIHRCLGCAPLLVPGQTLMEEKVESALQGLS